MVAVRSAPGVATLLSSIGAHLGRLEFEAGRVVGEVRSGVNRRLNAETANLRRTVAAALSQLEAIERLESDRRRWEALPPALREAAVLRRRRPRDSLEALAAAAGCSRPAMAGRCTAWSRSAETSGKAEFPSRERDGAGPGRDCRPW